MKALLFDKAGELSEMVHLSEVEKPVISANQVLISVKARPVNPSDYLFVKGVYRKKPTFPQIAGLEGSGIIVECGEGVVDFNIGDHVAFRALNTWAEYCAVEQEDLIKINHNIPFEASAQLGLNTITAIALLEEAKIKGGDFLLVNAASSSVSSIIIQLAMSKGIKVIALVKDLQHKPALISLGVEAIFLQADPALSQQLEIVTKGTGIHGFLDAVGGQIVTTVIPLMAAYGHIIIYGNFSNNEKAIFTNASIIYKNLTIIGFGIDYWLSQQSSSKIQQSYNHIVESLYTGTLSFRKTVSIPLSQFGIEMDHLNKPEKIIIV